MAAGSSFYDQGTWGQSGHGSESSESVSAPPTPPSAASQSNREGPQQQASNCESQAGTNGDHSWGRPSSWSWNGYWGNTSWDDWSWQRSSWDNAGYDRGWRRSSQDTTADSGECSSKFGEDQGDEPRGNGDGGDGAARTTPPTATPTAPPTTRFPGTSTALPRETPRNPSTSGSGIMEEVGKGPSERMVVPSFSGVTENDDGDIGVSARSYLRQVAAWRKMTRLPKDKQALVLYQQLSNKAWVEAENLDVEKLGSEAGVEYFMEWIRDRYLDVQVTQVGRSLSEFFRRLRKKPGQAIRDYVGEFDRAHARLIEAGCTLPDIAAAWVFVDRMQLEEAAELNLLASVGNLYDLRLLQRAAIVQDRALRKPWEGGGKGSGKNNKGEWWKNRTRNVFHTECGDDYDQQEYDGEDCDNEDDESPVPEEVAEELYEAYMTHETAKAKHRDMAKARGTDPGQLKKISEEKLRMAKSRSFCAGCKRKGHWHRDPECPLNQGKNGNSSNPSSTTATSGSGHGQGVKNSYQCHVVHVTWDLNEKTSEDLMAITDTACSRSVAGAPWLERYLEAVSKHGGKPVFINGTEKFKFGASKIFESRYSVIVGFTLGKYVVFVKTAIVEGDVPLLLSKSTLGAMGMIFDVAHNVADFTALSLKAYPLLVTETGHPALPLVPAPVKVHPGQAHQWNAEASEIQIVPLSPQYGVVHEVHMLQVLSHESTSGEGYCKGSIGNNGQKIFYPKKISTAVHNMLSMNGFCEHSFSIWWKDTNISQDFWIETQNSLIRIHVVPRRTLFNPLAWSTQHQAQKEALLDALGLVRSTWGIACGSHRGLPPILGKKMTTIHIRCSGSAKQFSLGDLCRPPCFPAFAVNMEQPPRTPPRKEKLWSMSKTELLEEAMREGLPVLPRWTLEEIRSVVREHRAAMDAQSPEANLKGLGSMTLLQLRTMAQQHGIEVPVKATRGLLMRLIRGAVENAEEMIVPFGRYRGWLCREVPSQYLQWCIDESSKNPNSSEDLRKLANFGRAKFAKGDSPPKETPYWMDPEANLMVPFPSTSDTSSEWSRVSAAAASSSAALTAWNPTRGYPKEKNVAEKNEMKGKGTSESPGKKGTRRSQDMGETARRMELDPDDVAKREIYELEARLAVLKQQHGIPPRQQ